MGTIPHKFETAGGKRMYRRYSAEFKQSVVEQSYLAGESVARLAQLHQINANQIFAWRKWARDQRIPVKADFETAAVFLPVTVSDPTDKVEATAVMHSNDGTAKSVPTDRIEVTVGTARLSIRGAPDAATLRAVLAQLLR